ncbi:MAG: ExeM/NucH family extracellular endonuclease [Methylovulum sp.]|nr:ExeM/NucH family extracellular endonuclease [Methylovulum sp.]
MTGTFFFKPQRLALAMAAIFNCATVAEAASSVVISQIYGGGGNAGAILKNDFIELFNRGATAVKLDGLSVQYAPSTGTSWQMTPLPSVTLLPGHYYLVQEAAQGGGTANLPPPDVTDTITVSATSGKVALVSNQIALSGTCPSNNVLDRVGYGSGANCAETRPTANLSNLTAAQRANGGCTDTDDNSSDFTVANANPRNTASAGNVCGGAVKPTVNLSVSSNEGNELGATVITLTATASVPVHSNQTINLAVTGTGITNADYTLSNARITIPDSNTKGSVRFTVKDDAIKEGLETATLSINQTSAGIALGLVTNQSITIADNDACGNTATKISVVQGQGDGANHPLNKVPGTTIEGIVVGAYQGTLANSLRGFFVQEENADADADPATSEGIFIFSDTNGKPNVTVGDKVRVTGTRSEYYGMTQLDTLTDVQLCATKQAAPTPATLTLPIPNVPNGNLDAAINAINRYYEAFEGMLVTFPATLTVSDYYQLERYGQLVLGQGGRIPTFTHANNPSVLGYSNQQIKLARRQVILDDKDNSQNSALVNKQALPYPTGGLSTSNRFRGGDSIKNLTGVLHWSFAGQAGTDAWRIRPVKARYDYTFKPANPRKNTPPSVGGTLKVASFNVSNYFTTIDKTASNFSGNCGPASNPGQDCRGADSVAELKRQTAKVAAAVCKIGADIVGLMEIENNATDSLSALASAANAVRGCGPYAYINTDTIGGDAIKVGLLYKTATISPIGGYALLDATVDSRFIDTKNRPSLAQTFSQTATGEALTIAVNHFKSKGSGCDNVGDPDTNDGQGNCNLTRKNAAMALVDWLAGDPTGSSDSDFLIIGDLNSHAKEDPVKVIEAGGYTNLVKTFGGKSAYSYVFDGQTGYLDHAFASPSLRPQVTGTADWHINADEPPSFDYNDTIKDVGEANYEAKPAALPLYAANPFRTSDHDPVIIGLELGQN